MPSASLLSTTISSASSLALENPLLQHQSNMTTIVRDSYQANGLIRNQQQHQQQQQQQQHIQQQQHLIPSMQVNNTSSLLRKNLQTSSPQFLYSSKQQMQQTNNISHNHHHHQQQQQQTNGMQFPPAPPPMAPMISQAATQVPKTDLSSSSSYGSILISQHQQHPNAASTNGTASQQHQQQHHQHMNGAINQANINGGQNQAVLMSPMSMPNLSNNSYQNYSDLPQQLNQQQQLYQQYYHLQQANNNSHQQHPNAITANNQKHNQHQITQNGHQLQNYQMMQQQNHQQQQNQHQQQNQQHHQQQQHNPNAPNQQLNNATMQQVPMTTIMIPASAAASIQSASAQIQQATMQAMNNNSGQPQILVFMIPYMISQQPPTVPPTPDQASLSSTLIKQSHLNSSFRLQQQQQQPLSITQTNKQQSQIPLHHQSQQIVVSQQQQTNSTQRAVSSLSNNATSTKVEHDKFYVKANFYYQPIRNKEELAFQKGEILHVLDTELKKDYGQYWLATKVDQTGKDFQKGLIPDRKAAEKLALEQRAHDISETGSQQDGQQGSSSGVISASVGKVNFLKRRAAQRSKSLCKDNWDNVVFDIGSMKFPPYERVIYRHPGFCRPVVIFGSLADFAREKLLRDYPEKYSYPSGFNQSPDHPKVIRLKGILEVIDLGKHALLDITPSAVEKLNYVNLAPIVIFMKTESKSIIKEFRSRAAQSLDMETRDDDTLRRDGKSSRKLLEQSIKLEKTWSHVFTVILDLSMMGSEQWYRKLRETIEDQQSANVWMSDRKTDKKVSVASASNMNEMLFSVPTVHQPTQTSQCMDNNSLLSERFNESLNLTSKSTLDLVPEGVYGNRSQMRIAHAHSIAQKLARASSEPKLNGLLSEDEDEDDDDDIIKKPFPGEYENSSSISSSNGATSYGHGSITGSNISYHGSSFGQLPPQQQQQQHQQQQQQQQQHLIQQANGSQANGSQMTSQYHQPQFQHQQNSLTNQHQDQNQPSSRQNGAIYARNPYLSSSKATNAQGVIGNKDGMMTSDDYHHLPTILSNGHSSDYHNTTPQTMIAANNINSNVMDLASNHDTRSSAFQVYSDMNQNIYH